MYSSEQTRQLQELSKSLLHRAPALSLTDKDLRSLRQVLVFHEYRYYILNDPLITDPEYDSLYKWLEKLESADPSRITPDSPTQRVGGKPLAMFESVRHRVTLLSLDNTFSADELRAFDERIKRSLDTMTVIEYDAELKIDGLTVSLTYENGILTRLLWLTYADD